MVQGACISVLNFLDHSLQENVPHAHPVAGASVAVPVWPCKEHTVVSRSGSGFVLVMVKSTRGSWYLSQSIRTQAFHGTMSKASVGRMCSISFG